MAKSKSIKKEVALGVALPKSFQDSPTYLLTEIKDYTATNIDIKRQIELSNKLYKYEGTVGTVVDILVDFAITRLRVDETGDKELDKIIRFFNDNVNIDNNNTLPGIVPLLQQVALEFYLSGNVFPYERWEEIQVPGIKTTISLPTSITILNPQYISIQEGPLMFGREIIELQLNKQLMSLLKEDGRSLEGLTSLKDLINKKVLRDTLKDNKKSVKVNHRLITHIKRKSRDYEAWGVPYLTRAFSIIALIKRMRLLDQVTTEGLINFLTIFLIGSEKHPATSSRIKAFAELMKNPTKSMMLVWYHDLDIKTVGPEGKTLNMENRYKEAYAELLRALGVPPVLIDQSGQQDPYVALLSLAQRLESFREQIKIWMQMIYRKIAQENGKENIYPTCKWSRTNLFNEANIKNLILAMRDRGLISLQTSLEEAGYDYTTEEKRLTREEESGAKELFITPKLPFSGNQPKEGRPTKDDKTTTKKTKTEETINLKEQKKIKPKTPVAKANDMLSQAFYERILNIYDKLHEQTLVDIQQGVSKEDIFSRIDGYIVYMLNAFKSLATVAIEDELTNELEDDCINATSLIEKKIEDIKKVVETSKSEDIMTIFNLKRTEVFNIIDQFCFSLNKESK